MPPKKKNKEESVNGEMIDYYDIMPKKFLLQSHNPNIKTHGINVPFRMLIIGGSGAGKTQTLLNLIKVMNGTFQNIHIITKNKDEPLYNFIEDKLGKQGLTITEGIGSAPDLDSFNKKEQSLIVMDDLVLEKNQKTLEQYFIRARKLNCSLVYISQSYFSVPKMIRQNLNYLIIKRLNTLQDLFRIMREYSLGVEKNTLQNIYEDSIKDNKQDFLLVDLDAEPKDRFRKNWDDIYNM
jgi:ABC-type dipeptide/oligopeptide/nickel transport system ATPase component|tara:strand:- start:576 stop:1286 length:711 start_codon:yes stop_codon:yes gene_type:complete